MERKYSLDNYILGGNIMAKDIVVTREMMNNIAANKVYGDGVVAGLTFGMMAIAGIEIVEYLRLRKIRKELKKNN